MPCEAITRPSFISFGRPLGYCSQFRMKAAVRACRARCLGEVSRSGDPSQGLGSRCRSNARL